MVPLALRRVGGPGRGGAGGGGADAPELRRPGGGRLHGGGIRPGPPPGTGAPRRPGAGRGGTLAERPELCRRCGGARAGTPRIRRRASSLGAGLGEGGGEHDLQPLRRRLGPPAGLRSPLRPGARPDLRGGEGRRHVLSGEGAALVRLRLVGRLVRGLGGPLPAPGPTPPRFHGRVQRLRRQSGSGAGRGRGPGGRVRPGRQLRVAPERLPEPEVGRVGLGGLLPGPGRPLPLRAPGPEPAGHDPAAGSASRHGGGGGGAGGRRRGRRERPRRRGVRR